MVGQQIFRHAAQISHVAEGMDGYTFKNDILLCIAMMVMVLRISRKRNYKLLWEEKVTASMFFTFLSRRLFLSDL